MTIVEGADLMAWGEEHGRPERGYRPAEVDMFTGLHHYDPKRAMHANLVLVGPADCTEEEHAFARRLQTASEVPPDGMHTAVTPFDPDAVSEPGGSTDVANISWVYPTIDLDVANGPQDVPAHSWASTAASGVDVLTQPELVRAMRAEFDEKSKAFPYVSPVGPEVRPGLPSHMRAD